LRGGLARRGRHERRRDRQRAARRGAGNRRGRRVQRRAARVHDGARAARDGRARDPSDRGARARRARVSAAREAELVVATGNGGKLREFRSLLRALPLVLRSLREFPGVELPEEGDDYEQNALAKARSAARETDLPALADDSGIEVEALGGAPGPRSA